MGVARSNGLTVAMRTVASEEAMTADWARMPADVLECISARIADETPSVSRAVYDVSSKPRWTIGRECDNPRKRNPRQLWPEETGLSLGHPLRHVEQQMPIVLGQAPHQRRYALEETLLFGRAPPRHLVRGLSPEQIRQFRCFLSVVEELVERNLQGAGQLLQGFDRRNRMAVFYSRDIAPQ